MDKTSRGASAASDRMVTDASIYVDESRTLVTSRFPSGGGFVMLIQRDEAGRPGADANKVFRFPKHRPPNWEDPDEIQLILDAVGITG